MFARLLPQRRSQNPRPILAPLWTPLLGKPIIRHPISNTASSKLSEEQLDHLLSYWAMGKHKPTTATVKASIFIEHLKICLDTDVDIEHRLQMTLEHDGLLPVARSSVIHYVSALTFSALRHASPTPDHTPSDGRYGVGIKAFSLELDDMLNHPTDPGVRRLLDGVDRRLLHKIIMDALQTVSHENQLAEQLRETAHAIRRMEDQLSRQTLPDEDLYELKLRRDLFLSDLQLYARLTRAAVETPPKHLSSTRPSKIRANPFISAQKKQPRQHQEPKHTRLWLSMIFGPCTRMTRYVFGAFLNDNRRVF